MPAVPCITYELRIVQAVSVLLAALQLPLLGRLQDGLHLPDGPPGYVYCTDTWQSGWCRPGSSGLPAVL